MCKLREMHRVTGRDVSAREMSTGLLRLAIFG